MAEYYFLASYLPQLEIGHMPALGFAELKELLQVNLTRADLEKVKKLLTEIDMENLRAYWVGEPLDPRGNYTRAHIEQALIDGAWPGEFEFPDYLGDYLEKYTTPEARIEHFPLLMSRCLEALQEGETGFLKEYFQFEREWRFVLVGFRAKKWGKDIDRELQYEDPNDPIIAQILGQKDASAFEPPFEYRELKPIFENVGEFPLELYKALYEYRFQRILDFEDSKFFSIECILGYSARLFLVEKWLELDMHQGIETIDTIERNIQ